jgi:hypothetical protein
MAVQPTRPPARWRRAFAGDNQSHPDLDFRGKSLQTQSRHNGHFYNRFLVEQTSPCRPGGVQTGNPPMSIKSVKTSRVSAIAISWRPISLILDRDRTCCLNQGNTRIPLARALFG